MCDLSRGPQGVVEDVIRLMAEQSTPSRDAAVEQLSAATRRWFREAKITDEQLNEDFVRGALSMLAVAFVRSQHVYKDNPASAIVDAIHQTMEFAVARDLPSASELEAMLIDEPPIV